MVFETKICGIRTAAALAAALDAGATQVGVVFFDASPRCITPEDAGALLAGASARLEAVGLFVDADDAGLGAALEACPLDWLQLHGAETPDRAREVSKTFGRPVMKALGVGAAGDLERARDYDGAVERILFDAKPPKGAGRPGGNAQAFDWRLLDGVDIKTPWMLSGGLTPQNVGEAVAACRGLAGFSGVDVSSGVESAPGEKDVAKIRAFIAAAREAAAVVNS